MTLKKNNDIFWHDIFNIPCTGIISFASTYYLFHFTNVSSIGTDTSIAPDGHDFFLYLYIFTSLYIFIDSLYILLIPTCVGTGTPKTIFFHHVLTMVLIALVYLDTRYEWHATAALFCEWTTFFLSLRRNLVRETFLHGVVEFFFYLSWVFCRLLTFPIITFLSGLEWLYRAEVVGTKWNIILLAPIFFTILTFLSFMWTFQLLVKFVKTKNS